MSQSAVSFGSLKLLPATPGFNSSGYGEGSGEGFLYDEANWTTLDFPGASYTRALGIDGYNVVGEYEDGSGYHGFLYQIPGCVCGDLDGSGGRVDLSDFNVFSVCFGLREPTVICQQELFDCADLNQDDWINLTDFSTFQVLFGTVSSNSPPSCTE